LPDTIADLEQSILIHVPTLPPAPETIVEASIYWPQRNRQVARIGPCFFVRLESYDHRPTKNGEGSILAIADAVDSIGSFVTFLGEREAYRGLIHYVGEELAKRLLLNVNDAAALQAFNERSPLLRKLRGSGMLDRLLAKDEQQFAFLSLRKIFSEQALIETRPDAFIAQVSIDGKFGLEVSADYEDVLGEQQPVMAVIGANGVGKSRLLLAVAKAAIQGNIAVRGHPKTRGPRLKVLSFTYERAIWSSLRRRGVGVVDLGITSREWGSLTSVLRELALTDSSRFHLDAYLHIIAKIVDLDQLFIPIATAEHGRHTVEIGRRHYLPIRRLRRGPRRLLGLIEPGAPVIGWSADVGEFSLSSGQRSLILLIAQLFRLGERSLVLVDEPENHLHPQFVTLLMQTLQSTLIAMESRAIVVTHSPFVVRELDKSAVQILDVDANGVPCLYQTSLQTFGADVGRISDYVFGDQHVRKGYEERIRRMVESTPSQSIASLEQRTGPRLGDDAELYLRRLLRNARNAD